MVLHHQLVSQKAVFPVDQHVCDIQDLQLTETRGRCFRGGSNSVTAYCNSASSYFKMYLNQSPDTVLSIS